MDKQTTYEEIFRNGSPGMALIDPATGRFEEVNRSYADELGYDTSDIESRSVQAVAEEAFSQNFEKIQRGIERALGGETERVYCNLAMESEDSRLELSFEQLSEDGSDRVLSTVRLADDGGRSTPFQSEGTIPLALEMAEIGIWEWNLETDEVIWSEAMEGLVGLAPGTFEGTFEAFARRVHSEDMSHVQEQIETAVETGHFYKTEFRMERANGDYRWYEARGKLLSSGDGPRMVGAVTDITERKTRQRELHEQDRQYRELVDRLPVAYYTLDQDWNFRLCNDALADRLGTSVEDLVGTNFWDEFPNLEGTIIEEMYRTVRETGVAASTEYQWEDRGYWVELQAYPFRDGVAVVSTDITDRREKLSMILDSMPIVVFRYDRDGIIMEARGQVLDKLGLEAPEVVGKSVFDLYGDNPDLVDAVERALEGEELRRRLKLDDVLLETKYAPLFENGEITGVAGVSMDVTELERQRAQLEFFNSILRHDVLNGMTVIKTRADILADQLEGEHRQYAETIVEWTEQVTDVTDRIRQVIETLTTPDEDLTLQPIEVSPLLEDRIQDMADAYPEVRFETDLEPGARALGDELLADVFGNILSNSIEHNETEDLEIRATVETGLETVSIRISDNGRGIPHERKDSVFRRGESSHAKETGSGFGLFFANVLVRKYGGTIAVEDSAEGGARFVIELPRETEED